MSAQEWEKMASNILKAELARRGMGYEELRDALLAIGIDKSYANLNKTINGGKFPFYFFLQCAEAIGIEKLTI